MPLCLVRDLLALTREHDKVEKQAAEQAVIDRVLADRDSRILKGSPRSDSLREAINVVRKVLDADRRARGTPGDVPQRLSLSDTSRGQLQRLCDGAATELVADARPTPRTVQSGRARPGVGRTLAGRHSRRRRYRHIHDAAPGNGQGAGCPGRSLPAAWMRKSPFCSRSGTICSRSF